jgi:hypothetical protein
VFFREMLISRRYPNKHLNSDCSEYAENTTYGS